MTLKGEQSLEIRGIPLSRLAEPGGLGAVFTAIDNASGKVRLLRHGSSHWHLTKRTAKPNSVSGRADSHTQKEKGKMRNNKGTRYLSSILLMGALAAPMALQAQERDDHHDRDDQAKNQRVYDRQHKDYHQWNANEDQSYRQWYTESHNGKDFREYGKLKSKDQNAYWNWRHQHGDNDDHHDGDRR
jgi:hypothetical protein